jgi:hypothetical protein
MRQHISFLLIAAAFVLLFACKKETEIVKPDYTSRYAPNQAGRYIIYQVDSLYYNQFASTIDTFSYQLKEEITELYTDNEGRNMQRLQRYKKVNDEWVLTRVWSAFAGNRKYQKSEENISFVKMVFPLMKDSSWNGNAYNSLGAQSYTCTALHTSLKFLKLSFDSCAVVSQKLDSTLISKEEEKEVFAIGIGLVHKRSTYLEDRTSSFDPSVAISKRANYGTDVRMYAIDYGVK